MFVTDGITLPSRYVTLLYTPKRGITMFSGKRWFMVGLPMVLPMRLPSITLPSIEKSYPSSLFAFAISPDFIRFFMAVECTTHPSRLNGGIITTSMPYSRHIHLSSSASLPPPAPSLKSNPHTTTFAFIIFTRTFSMKSLAV